MDRIEFLQLREAATTSLPAATGAVLEDAAARLRRRLAASAMFAQVEVEVTQDPERLLVALVRFRPGTPERQVSSFLEAVWITELRLSAMDVFTFHLEDGQVELDAVTGDHGSGYFVSLQLVALQGDPEDFEDADRAAPPAESSDGSRGKRRFWKKS